jgi:hypothetical protein
MRLPFGLHELQTFVRSPWMQMSRFVCRHNALLISFTEPEG